jgi:hypothetical protein
VPRYKLLLQAMLKNTLETHSDWEKLSQAFEVVCKVALHINEQVTTVQQLCNHSARTV